MPYHIAIEGTIGVGKTSLAGILGDRLEAKLILEEFEENPFLVEFYKDSDRFAFQTQLFFLLSRYRQQQQLQQTDLFTKTLISDYMFVKDRLFAALNLDDKEMSLYNTVARILEKNVASPDMVIFLQSDTDRLMQNIKLRGREYEKLIDWKYIDALNQMYNEYFFRYDDSPLLIINTNDIDFVNNKDDLEEIIEFIRTPGEGTRYFNPIKSIY
ncbi:MAG TPA: deoxynucleoside kinase [Candidatus Marinimicrobia bacterium]|nr:deoxynucleoside kinase [Candidatus Neomarinimicrobiota bacterium]HIB14006.1 deoxynucleoside kinase [Candidatus Neomarinimicrobiota bacterium]HIM52944.1 deoxynucleoside kinase [Candidatus Neomarinimicrobiota bacterium]HIN19489.1 deoxynucleoside kinase [Candidatus Neomarinimicrobiota bacterium]HIO40191.1 deoxynucleoside kinase [Candidatus Neomarinimicrobiota bacterium]